MSSDLGSVIEIAVRVISVTTSANGWVMSFAEAYFDETRTEDARSVFAIAGILFRKDDAIRQALEWEKMLSKYKLPYFHMTDCALNQGVFARLSKEQCGFAERDAIRIIRDTASAFVYVTIEINHPSADWDALGYLGGPYEWCAISVPTVVSRWCELNPEIKEVHYFFEHGAEGQSNARYHFSNMMEIDDFKDQCRFAGMSFVKKECSPGVQAADIVVWHTGKDAKRAFAGEPRRKDFSALIDEIPAYGGHWNTAMLQATASEIRSFACGTGLPVEKLRQIGRLFRQKSARKRFP